MTDIELKIPNTDISLKDIIQVVSKRISAVFVLDVINNSVIPVKSSLLPENIPINWDDELDRTIDSTIAPQFRAAAKVLYSRECVKKQMSALDLHSELIFERTNGEWNTLNLIPITVKDGKCSVALIIIIDITAAKKRTDSMTQQMQDAHRSVNDLNRIFFYIAKNYFSQVIKFDIVSGETTKVAFNGGSITETPVISWTVFFEKLFSTIHPDDYKEVTKYFDLKVIRDMVPGTKRQLTYRTKDKDGKYRWKKTIILITEEEPTTAVSFTSDITKDVSNNTILSTLLT